MSVEENLRNIEGASAYGASIENSGTKKWLGSFQSAEYEPCPQEYKNLIENRELEELVFWKLREKFEKTPIEFHEEILKEVISEVERPLFTLVLSKANGNQSRAAQMLGCNRNTLHRKLKEFFINPKDIKSKSRGGAASKRRLITSASISSGRRDTLIDGTKLS